MDKEKITKKVSKKKEISINIRITKDLSKWLKKNNFSPTAIFYESIKELGYKQVQ